MQLPMPHGEQRSPLYVCPARTTIAEEVLCVSSLLRDDAKSIGSRKMQTAAKNNLFLTDLSSKELLETRNSGKLYQQIVLNLIGNLSVSSSNQAAGNLLVTLAEHASAVRQTGVMDEIGRLLLGLPFSKQHKAIGLYYRSLATLRQGDCAGARLSLETAFRNAPPFFKGKAMLSVSATFRREGDLASAWEACEEARLASRLNGSTDPLVSYLCQHNVAILKSALGDHGGALGDLEKLFPVARSLSTVHPQQYYSYLNSLAIELSEVGRTAEAQNICRITLASPLARAYPEWHETASEIGLSPAPKSTTITLVRSRMTFVANNVLHLRTDRNIGNSLSGRFRQLPEQQARVLSFTSWKTQMSREPLAKPKPRVSVGQMTRKQKIIRIVDLVCNEISDEQLDSILQAVERIAPDEKVRD
jgi:hypothetical protein